MTGPFGDGPVVLDRDRHPSTAARDMTLCSARLAALADPAAPGVLRVHRPPATAAFSRRDSLAAGFGEAERAARGHGFAPVVRPAGGRLAAYGPGALVLDLVGRHDAARAGIRDRFALLGEHLAAALRALGVPAAVGPVPGEFCPGEFSVHAAGTTKVAGTAQRLTRHGYLFSTVLLVTDPDPVRAVLVDCQAALGVAWRPASVGCLADHVPGITVDDAEDAVLAALGRLLPGLPRGDRPAPDPAPHRRGRRAAEEDRWPPLSTRSRT